MKFSTRIDDYTQEVHAAGATEAAVKAIRRWREHGFRWIGDRRESVDVHVMPIDGLGRVESQEIVILPTF